MRPPDGREGGEDMKRRLMAFLVAVLVVAAGCVLRTKHTIDAHIVVDIRYVEEKADDVLDFIEGKTDELPDVVPEPTSWLDQLYDDVAPVRTAYAAEAEEEMDAKSKLVDEVLEKMRKRHPKLEALKKTESLGEDNRGYVALRESETLADPEKKNEAQKLVHEENTDRKGFYKELVRLNRSRNLTLTDVERVYARKRLERAKPGEIFQLPEEGKDFDKFKNESAGKKLGDACKPGAWVKIK
jgi:uncharacterized protein YdbL (DUF1318 family)